MVLGLGKKTAWLDLVEHCHFDLNNYVTYVTSVTDELQFKPLTVTLKCKV